MRSSSPNKRTLLRAHSLRLRAMMDGHHLPGQDHAPTAQDKLSVQVRAMHSEYLPQNQTESPSLSTELAEKFSARPLSDTPPMDNLTHQLPLPS